jgi:hypothetical protein
MRRLVWVIGVVCGLAILAVLIYLLIFAPTLQAHDAVVEQQGFQRGVAHAGRKCWYNGYFMDGTQRYNCSAVGNH